jgi:hypothetical protein
VVLVDTPSRDTLPLKDLKFYSDFINVHLS